MKWDKNVVLKRENNKYFLICGSNVQEIAIEDKFIADAVSDGTDDAAILKLVMDREGTDEEISGFRIAQFVVEYGSFISNDVGHMEILP